jgi:hypothetical protein
VSEIVLFAFARGKPFMRLSSPDCITTKVTLDYKNRLGLQMVLHRYTFTKSVKEAMP